MVISFLHHYRIFSNFHKLSYYETRRHAYECSNFQLLLCQILEQLLCSVTYMALLVLPVRWLKAVHKGSTNDINLISALADVRNYIQS